MIKLSTVRLYKTTITFHLAQAAVSEQQPRVLPSVFQWN